MTLCIIIKIFAKVSEVQTIFAKENYRYEWVNFASGRSLGAQNSQT